MKNIEKFSNKADDYMKYRPSYPGEFIEYLHNSVCICESSIVADIGAGTGILTKLLSPIAGRVFAVEPNESMRNAGIKHCEGINNIDFSDECAEETKLKDGSLDFITVAQAFHWFDKEKTKLEFQRILKPDGKVILVWNRRVPDNKMLNENDELLRKLCPEFTGFSGGSIAEEESDVSFFRNSECERRVFQNDRVLSLEEFIGGSLSASYAPNKGDVNYEEFLESLTNLFYKYSVDGKLTMPNNTHSYVGFI